MKKSIANAEHYNWGSNCDGWHLLKSDSLSVIQEKMPPGTSERLHYHTYAQQMFYILTGTASFEIEGKAITLIAGESIHVEQGKRHGIANLSTTELNFLVISTPKAHGDRTNIGD
jgi:quercetin dioxygenase-like cupin family protein